MAEFNETYAKAETLLRQALEKLSNGDAEGAQTNIELARKYLDLGNTDLNTEWSKISMLYGESRNFGIIYNVFEQNADKLYETKKGREVIAKFIKTIKDTPILTEQFHVYNKLSSKPTRHTNDNYVNETIDLIATLDINEMKNANEKLIAILQENNVDELVDIDDNTIALYEAIEYIATHKRTLNNIDEYLTAKTTICENIINEPELVETKDMFSDLNEKVEMYNEKLNDDEIALIKEINESNDKEGLYKEYKQTLITTLNECMRNADHSTKVRLQNITETVNNMHYNPDTLIEDIAKYIEIENELKED